MGRDLVESAKVRSTAGQLEQASAAINTFELKYGSLPGDIPAAKAQSYGLPYEPAPNRGDGDDNGSYVSPTTNIYCGGCYGWISGEVAYFFPQLSAANLISGKYDWYGDAGRSQTSLGVDFPALKMDPTNGMLPFSSASMPGNWLSLNCNVGPMVWLTQTCSITYSATDTNYSHAPQSRFTPQRSYALDAKIDDGKPGTGILRAIRSSGDASADNFAGVCVTDASSTTYNTSNTTTQNVCSLAYKF